ncbi:MAG: protein phosphatase 2C domain-containing protein [bacterium]
MQRRKKERKTIISFSIYSHKRFQQPQNQDYDGKFPREHLTPKGQLFVVANGINGHPESRAASEMVVNIINQVYYSDPSKDIVASLRQAFKDANTLLYELFNSNDYNQKMGISCTALVLTKDQVYIAHIGNNLAYRITRHMIEKLTNNTLVGEMHHQAILSKKDSIMHQNRSKQSFALGLESSVNIAVKRTIPIKTGDCYLLCSDGLVNIDDQEIKNIVLSNTPKQACKKLIYFANKSNINVQVIRIKSVSLKPFWAKPLSIKLLSANKIRSLSVALLFLLAIAIIYKSRDKFTNQIVKFSKLFRLQNEDLLVKQPNPFEQRIAESQKVKKMVAEANIFFHSGKLDSALQTYQAILQSYPMHLGAIYAINQLAEAYKNKANFFHQKAYYQQALNFFRKAAQLQPNNKELLNRISESEKKLQTIPSSNTLIVAEKKNKVSYDNSTNNQVMSTNSLKSARLDIKKRKQTYEWNFLHLAEEDHEVKNGKIIFLDSPNRKKVLYRSELANFSIQVQAKVINSNFKGRYGIILGYKTMDEEPYETFYLFSVFRQKQFLLQKYSNFKKELIISIPTRVDQINDDRSVQLKVKCQGPYIILYANQRRLYVCYGYENIKGRVGLYADPNLRVEFSKIEISKALDLKKDDED